MSAETGRLSGYLRVGYRGSLDEVFSGRNNGFGAIRLALATSVVVSHSRSLGFGGGDLFSTMFRGQEALGGLAVSGFFVLSGMLITRSASRTGSWRYIWHRALRIFPGFWICLTVTALVVAPLVALHEHGTTAGFWTHPQRRGGPGAYITQNFFTGIQQFGVHDLLTKTTPWGRKTGGSAFDGALWSLIYEMLCYVVIGVLAVTRVLRSHRVVALAMTVALYFRIVSDFLGTDSWHGGVVAHYPTFVIPYIGVLDARWIVYLGFLFMTGALFELYKEHIPIHDALGLLAAALVLGSLLTGGWYVIGYPAFAYTMIWAAVRAPRRLHWIGRKNDYSYGVYIYGFIGQQVMASLGWTRWGLGPYLALSVGVAFAAAYVSWHLVERHALRLKHWTPKHPSGWAHQVRSRLIGQQRTSPESTPDPVPLPIG